MTGLRTPLREIRFVTFTLRYRRRLAAPVFLLGLAVPVAAQALSQGAGASTIHPAATRATSAATVQPSAESQLLSLTNGARARAGLPALVSSATLVSVARGWSAHMAAAHALSHNPNLAGSVTGWYMIGENVAQATSSIQAQSLFMSSSEHRANILEARYNMVGIGVVQAADGSIWFTVDFEQTAGYRPAAHQPAAHRWAPTPRPGTSTSAADRLLAARRSALARASRSLARAGVGATGPSAAAGSAIEQAAARAARLRGQDGGSVAGARAGSTSMFGPTRATGSGSLTGLILFAVVAVLFILTNLAWQRHAQRTPR